MGNRTWQGRCCVGGALVRIFQPMRRLFLLGACAAILFTAGCGKPAPQEPAPPPAPAPVKILSIGVFLPLKGAGQASGEAALNGLAMAAEEVNASGGVIGQAIRLVVRDTRSEPERSVKAVRDLVEEDKVAALVGGFSAGSVEAAVAADESGVPLIALGSTMPGVRLNEPGVFRICQRDFLSGRVMAKFAATLGSKRALVLYEPSSEYSKTLALAFGKQFKRKQGTRILGEPFAEGTTDFTKHIENIRKANPDVVYLPVSGDMAAAIITKAREAGIAVPFLGTAMWDSPEFVASTGAAGENCYFPGKFNPEGGSGSAKVFLAGYSQKHSESPSAPAALGYDALAILANAIRTAGTTDALKLREALDSTRNFPGLTGPITTDPELSRPHPTPVLKIEEGRIMFLELIDPA